MTAVRIDTTITVEIDLETAAKWFAQLSDDEMCRFLVAVAEEAKSWPNSPDSQWYYLGGHLRNCECSTNEAREMIRAWAAYMETSTHGATA